MRFYITFETDTKVSVFKIIRDIFGEHFSLLRARDAVEGGIILSNEKDLADFMKVFYQCIDAEGVKCTLRVDWWNGVIPVRLGSAEVQDAFVRHSQNACAPVRENPSLGDILRSAVENSVSGCAVIADPSK
jgi:uncharacterized protein (DUF2461 family)